MPTSVFYLIKLLKFEVKAFLEMHKSCTIPCDRILKKDSIYFNEIQMEESFFMNLQRSTFLVLHIVFMPNRSLISCYVEKRRQCFRQKKRYRTLHFEFIACLLLVLSTLLDITLRLYDFATNRTKRSTLDKKGGSCF